MALASGYGDKPSSSSGRCLRRHDDRAAHAFVAAHNQQSPKLSFMGTGTPWWNQLCHLSPINSPAAVRNRPIDFSCDPKIVKYQSAYIVRADSGQQTLLKTNESDSEFRLNCTT